MFRDVIIKRALIVFMMFAVFNLVIGCQENAITTSNQDRDILFTSEPEGDFICVDLPIARVSLSNCEHDSLSGMISFKYHYRTEDNQMYFRKLMISKISDEGVGFEIIVSDQEKNKLWTWSMAVDTINSISYMVEKTSQDSLFIIHTYYNDLINDEYNYNGSLYSVEYTEEELNQFYEWYNQVEKEDNTEYDKFTDFLDFFPEMNSLNDNIDGEIIVFLFDDTEFKNWLKSGLSYLKEKPVINNASVEDICKIACATAGIKCMVGGFLLNPLCHAAVGVCTACIIYWVIKLF